jgi:hypothetical protein
MELLDAQAKLFAFRKYHFLAETVFVISFVTDKIAQAQNGFVYVLFEQFFRLVFAQSIIQEFVNLVKRHRLQTTYFLRYAKTQQFWTSFLGTNK